MRVAVTGLTGFTGGFVSAALEQMGATAVALLADLCDKDAVDKAVNALDFDRVIHLAGHAFVNASDWRNFYAVNHLGTLNLLDALARKQSGMRCILASSAQVYGPRAEGLIAEHAPVNPANHYAVSKWAMEQSAQLWRNELDIVITRPFNYTGIGQDNQYLIPKIVDHFRKRADVIELGNTWVRRDFGDVRSVAAACAGLALAKDVPPVVNIATGHVSSISDIMDELRLISRHEMAIKVNQAFVREGDVEVLGGDATLLRGALPDWKPIAIKDTLRWMYEA